MKSFKQYISEASFKIDMPDMPAVYVDAKSAGEVKKKLRTLLKKPTDVEVTRVNPAKVKKAFRLRAQGKDEDEEEIKEDGLDESVIDKVKEIDRKKSAKKIDGVMVDSFTASAISQVYDKVSDANKKKMDKLPIKKLADLAMKFIKHGEEFVPEEVDLDEIKEGTWALPDTPKKKAALKKLMSKPIKLGREGDKAQKSIYSLIGDDELFDDLYVAGKKNPNGDARDVIKKALMRLTNSPTVGMAMKRLGIKEEVELDEISRSMTPMRDKFGSGKKLTLKDFKRGMFVITKKGEVGKIVANEPRADQVVVKMNRTKKEVELNWKKLGLYTEPRLKGLVQAEALDERRGRPRKDGTSDGDLENIQMQLRKSVSLRGKKDVEFADGKKKKVDDKVARKVLQMIDKYRRAQDKQNVVNYIAKSEKNLMSFASGKVKDSEMDPEAKRKKLLGIK